MKPRDKAAWVEILGIGVLALLAAWFLHESWRKWADPIIDSGPQWYATWRVSLGAIPYHDFVWNYGPLSIFFNGLLFKCFGPGMMVLATANLIIYVGIATLAYCAFRLAWGPMAAFAALAVFISVFSFSMLNTVGNYNYVLPYTNETTHGMLLMLLTVFVVVRWCEKPSERVLKNQLLSAAGQTARQEPCPTDAFLVGRGSCRAAAFLLGLCGGIATVLKPEFMLAWGVLATAALLIRFHQHHRPRLAEYGLIMAGVAMPTLCFTAWFARIESWQSAFADSSHAWWVVLVNQNSDLVYQDSYVGFDHAWRNVGWELATALSVALIVAAIWAAGWSLNRPWRPILRWATALGALFLAGSIDMGGGFEVGPCLPGLIAVAFVIVLLDLRRSGYTEKRNLMALALVLLAAAMLVRMLLRTRINHFGFIQAAFAGMVVTAVIVAKVPQWTGPGIWGRRVTLAGIMVMLLIGCGAVVAESNRNHVTQTQSVGSGSDRFYAFAPELDQTGLLVDWSVEQMKSAPADATLLVLPEGAMINYLSRHRKPLPEYHGHDAQYLEALRATPPDYVIVIWGDQRDNGYSRFGDPGHEGEKIMNWLRENYVTEAMHKGRKWAFIFRKKPGGAINAGKSNS